MNLVKAINSELQVLSNYNTNAGTVIIIRFFCPAMQRAVMGSLVRNGTEGSFEKKGSLEVELLLCFTSTLLLLSYCLLLNSCCNVGGVSLNLPALTDVAR